jgi:hypothetical protein
MNDSDIGELLKAAKERRINTGIVVVSTYPTKEHRDLLRASKPGTTPLNSSLGFRNARVPTDPKLRVVYLANYGVSYGSPPSLTQGKSKVSRFLQSLQTFWPPKASPKDVRLPFTPSQISVLLSWAYESPDLVF